MPDKQQREYQNFDTVFTQSQSFNLSMTLDEYALGEGTLTPESETMESVHVY